MHSHTCPVNRGQHPVRPGLYGRAMGRDSTAFYSTVAYLLPILLLAKTVHGRLWSEEASRESLRSRVLVFGVLVLFCVFAVVGEALCFYVLLGGEATPLVRRFTLIAVIVSACLLLQDTIARGVIELSLSDAVMWATLITLSMMALAGTVLVI